MRKGYLAAVITLATASFASAVTVTTFDNFTPTSAYGSWPGGTITSGATGLGVQATGFGGAYCNIDNVNGSGADTIQFTATVTSGTVGFVVCLGDTAGHEYNYAWYGNPAGTYTFTKLLSQPNFTTNTPGALDLANLDYLHIQVDPGMFGGVPYNVSYDDLQVTVTPEPASLAMLTLGGLVLRRRR